MSSSRSRPPLFVAGAVALALGSCGDGAPSSPRAATRPAPAVVVAELRAETVPVMRDFVARTEAVETVDIQARVEAILMKMEFEEGKLVEAGAVLYRLDDRTYTANLAAARARLAQARAQLKLAEEQVTVRAAEAGLAQSRARLKKAQQDVARLRPLAEKDAVPRQDLDTALAAEEVAEAELQASDAALVNSKIQEEVGILMARAAVEAAHAHVALAELDVGYCTIVTPIAGLIGRTEVDVGNLVGRGEATVLVTVSSVDPIYATFAISEGEYLELAARDREREGERGDPPLELVLADDSVYAEIGRIVTVDRALAEQTGTLQIVGEFPNPDGALRPGQFGRVRLRMNVIEDAVLVPQRAVMEQQGTKIVYIVGEGDVVVLRTIQVVERYESFFVVTKGLEAGERVIVEGQLKARPGSPVRPMAHAVSAEPSEE